MAASALLALLNHTDQKASYEQLRTWVVAQAIRNALQRFHGRPAINPDNPASGEGFITDGQMRALNITIRRAVHEAIAQVEAARNAAIQPRGHGLHPRQQEALRFCEFQLGTVHDYMEPPGSPELEEAYGRYVGEPTSAAEPPRLPTGAVRSDGPNHPARMSYGRIPDQIIDMSAPRLVPRTEGNGDGR